MIIGVASADHLGADKSPDGVEKWGGAGWARLGQNLPFWRAAGHTVITGILFKRPDALYIFDASTEEFTACDVFVTQRLMLNNLDEAMRFGQSKGQVIINDVDDWYWNLDTRNDAWKTSHPKYNTTFNTGFYHKVLGASDLLVTSTDYISHLASERFKVPIRQIENTVDVTRFPKWWQQPNPIMGWTGSTRHRSGDLEVIRGLVLPQLERNGWRLHHAGAWLPEDGLEERFGEMIGVPEEMYSSTPRATHEDYPFLLKFDVGLVPLKDIPFNYCKSNIKGLEYAAAGIPFIASPMPEYVKLHKQWGGEGFLLAKKNKDWLRAFDRLRDYEYRLDMQAHALELIKAHDVSYGAAQWLEVLEGVSK